MLARKTRYIIYFFYIFREFKIEGGGKENLPHACFEPLYLFTTIKFDLTWFATIKLC